MAETVRVVRVEVKITTSIAGTDGAALNDVWVYDKTFNEGTAANQLGAAWLDQSRALNTTSEDLDMSGATLKDFQGAGLAFNNLKVIAVENLDTDSGDYLLFKEGSSAAMADPLGGTSPTVKIGPGGLMLLVSPVDGYTVTDSSADTLAMEAVDNSTYRILVAGDNA